jgi:hypothetical protein
VEFTPWCSSNSPSAIVKTLNDFFQKLDQFIKTTSSMIRIKLICDCYMAADGLFQETNQPITHAQEAISLGFYAISIIRQFNQENNSNLQI